MENRICPVCNKVWQSTPDNRRNQTCSQSCGNALGSGTPWTDVQLGNLKKLYIEHENGKIPINDVAKLLNKTPSAVRYKAHKLGITDPSRPRAHNPKSGREGTAVVYSKICPNPSCGKVFEVGSSGKHQVCCSRRCSALRRMSQTPSGLRVRAKSGRRADLNDRYFRSSWEANYARYLNFLRFHGVIQGWEYEPKTFYFPIKRGNRHYTPDFLVYFSDGHVEWHEIKGYMDDNSRVKLKRFSKFYPEERLTLVDKTAYNQLSKDVSSLIPNWE